MIFLGLGFKTSAVPLHVWVPDVYQGAPTPVTAYLSVGSKLAGLRARRARSHGVLRARQRDRAGAHARSSRWSRRSRSLYGNLGAIPQTNIKRLMGYSSIAQCGYILVGVARRVGDAPDGQRGRDSPGAL